MADNDAVRSQRYLLHKMGDHSICKIDNCPYAAEFQKTHKKIALEPMVKPEDPPPVIDKGFGPSGAAYWAEMVKTYDIGVSVKPLLVEACRIIDRLDKLDAILKWKQDWLRITRDMSSDDPNTYKIVMSGSLREAREQSIALRGLITEMRNKLEVRADGTVKVRQSGMSGMKDDLLARRAKAAS